MKKYKSKNVCHIEGCMNGYANIANARAINANAKILENVLDRLEVLEEKLRESEKQDG